MPEPMVVPPSSDTSAAYTEWEMRIDSVSYCIVQEGTTMTLLRRKHGEWIEEIESVDEFLDRYNLELG